MKGLDNMVINPLAAGVLYSGTIVPESAPGRNRTFVRRLTAARSAIEPPERKSREESKMPLGIEPLHPSVSMSAEGKWGLQLPAVLPTDHRDC